MKYAAIAMSSVFGGKLKSYDANTAMTLPGVLKVVEIKGGEAGLVHGMDDAIAVVADDWWRARTALEMMPREWDDSGFATVDSNALLRNLRAGLEDPTPKVLRKEGDVEAALKSAAKELQAEYFVPYLEQATMGTNELHCSGSR